MKVYVTNKLLTKGIREYDLVPDDVQRGDLLPSYASRRSDPAYLLIPDECNLIGPNDWFTSQKAAQARAREIVRRKISATEKLLARLRALDTSLA